MFSQMIFMITMEGTARIMPRMPHIQPNRERETSITNGETPRLSPSIFGSTMFPKTMFTRIAHRLITTGARMDG